MPNTKTKYRIEYLFIVFKKHDFFHEFIKIEFTYKTNEIKLSSSNCKRRRKNNEFKKKKK